MANLTPIVPNPRPASHIAFASVRVTRLRFVLVCRRLRPSILAIAFSCLGVAVCPALGQWTSAINISNTDELFSTGAHFVLDANGHMHVVFLDHNGPTNRLYYATNAGGTWSKNPIRSSGSGFKGTNIAITPDNVLHVFYGLNEGLHTLSKPAVGGAWSGSTRLDDNHPQNCPPPDATHPGNFPEGSWVAGVAVNSAGHLFFQWLHLFDNDLNPSNGLWGRRKPFNAAWECIELVAPGTQDDFPGGGWLTSDGVDFYCTYTLDDLDYRRRTGGAWSGPMPINPTGGSGRLLWSPTSNEMAAVWSHDFDSNAGGKWWEVFVKFSTDGGQNWSQPFNVSDKNHLDRGPHATYDSNGDLHIVWEGFDCEGCAVNVWYRARINGAWQSKDNLTQTSSKRTTPADIQSRGDRLFLVYTDNENNGFEDVYVMTTAPEIRTSTSLLEQTSFAGHDPASVNFTVRNAGPQTIDYAITSNVPWLTANPAAGASSGEADTITLDFENVNTFNAGQYTAFVNIDAAQAWNTPQVVEVRLVIESVGPDADGDGDVDQVDFGKFQVCLTGSSVPQNDPSCLWARLDEDEDVDQNDFGVLQACYSGPNVPASPSCAD